MELRIKAAAATPMWLWLMIWYGGFLKWWVALTISMGFPTVNDHFGVFWGYHHLRKHPGPYAYMRRGRNILPVVPGQAGGGSFKEKNYKSKKEFAYRMRARRPTSAMPKPFLCCERAFCRSMVVMFCALKWSVLMSWCLLRGQVMWWSRHLIRCDGLCCVISRDAMRCHGEELYYSSTTLYYKVLLQYYPVLQSTTPVLPCTTKYYSSTNLYYKVLLQY